MAEIVVLRVVHVMGGIFWVGSGLFSAIFLIPAVSKAGPGGMAVMGGLQRRRLFLVVPAVAALTLLSGLRLLWIGSGGFSSAYFGTPGGATFGGSGAAAIAAFVLALGVSRPAGARARALTQRLGEIADEGERGRAGRRAERLARRSRVAGQAATVLLIASALGMSIGRYMNVLLR